MIYFAIIETITNILGSIDKKIEINNKKIEKLEAIARDIYDYWFVQYEFPDENGKPYKSNGGQLIWNEELKREIPVGWEILKIENILSPIQNSHRFSTTEYQDKGKYPIIDQSEKYICGYTDDEKNILSPKSCIIFGDHTKILKYVNFSFARGADGTQIILSNNKNLPNSLLYLQLKNMSLPNQGYTRYFKYLKDKLVLIPRYAVSNAFQVIVDKCFSSKSLLIEKNINLTRLRDFILPLLMNGQVTVI